MQVIIKNFHTGKTIKVDVNTGDTIATVKARIQEYHGFSMDGRPIELIFAGMRLEDGSTLADYNVQKEITLHMVIRQQIFNISTPGGNKYPFELKVKKIIFF